MLLHDSRHEIARFFEADVLGCFRSLIMNPSIQYQVSRSFGDTAVALNGYILTSTSTCCTVLVPELALDIDRHTIYTVWHHFPNSRYFNDCVGLKQTRAYTDVRVCW